jgi:hypothetical protein
MPIAIQSVNCDCSILRLQSSDLYVFELSFSQALHSGFLKRLLTNSPVLVPSGKETVTTINLDTIDSFTLKEVLRYIELLDQYASGIDLDRADKLMTQFLNQQRSEAAWEKILAAADFLEI